MPQRRPIVKFTVKLGYRVKLLRQAFNSNPRDPDLSKMVAYIVEKYIDEKIESGEISPITEEDVAIEQNLSVESFFKDLKKKKST